jgi:hypothetical protein
LKLQSDFCGSFIPDGLETGFSYQVVIIHPRGLPAGTRIALTKMNAKWRSEAHGNLAGGYR